MNKICIFLIILCTCLCFSCKSKKIVYDNSTKETIFKYKIKYLAYSDETIYSFKHYKFGVNYGAINQAVITKEAWVLKYCTPRSLGDVNRVKERNSWYLAERKALLAIPSNMKKNDKKFLNDNLDNLFEAYDKLYNDVETLNDYIENSEYLEDKDLSHVTTLKNAIDNGIELFNKYNDYIISKLDSCLK
ncbi:hypothetical protein D0T84_01370 [Dysgonomonas sp. 521]|uniref:hypothetical protein n=1 Tax=Dysgonomonas sp. 521 TaxID=2302932 RepID=UPI0013D19A38|nr:hypothetical protein [Dysgonomonas sp. 521]NDV93567.1 hypothetical protein [Dysgonomonas sp. 521]